MHESSINYVSSLCSLFILLDFSTGRKGLIRFWEEGFLSLPMCVPINSFSILPQCDGVNNSEAQAGRPFELPSWNTGQGNRGSVLGAVFSFPLRGAFDDCWSKGCFCDQGKLTLVLFERPTVLGFSNLDLLKSCHSWYLLVLVLRKVWELPPYRRQVAGVGHGWTKNPLTPAQLHTHQFYIIEGNCAEAPTVIWSFWFCLPWHHFVQLVWLFMSRRLWL